MCTINVDGRFAGREYRKSADNQAFPDTTTSAFQSQRTSTVSSSRRHRRYQPDETNKKEKSEPGEIASTQAGGIAESSTFVGTPHEPLRIDSKPASMTSGPRQQIQIKGRKCDDQPVTRTQLVKMDASRPELDLVHFDGVSEPYESGSSSLQIITERKPSCWSAASPPEAVSTEWNSVSADIDKPARPSLPIYRIPPKAKREIASSPSSPFHRQQARLKPHTNGFMPKTQKPFETDRPTRSASPANDGVRAPSRVEPLDDGHAADPVHRESQLPCHKARLDAEQASQAGPIGEEVLSRTVQVSLNVKLGSNTLKAFPSPIQHAPQAELSDVKETTIASSPLPSQKKKDHESLPLGKQHSIVPPHLRVHSERPGIDKKINSLPPHLRILAHPSDNSANEMTMQGEDPEGREHTSSASSAKKLPPHLRVPSTTDIRATKDSLCVTSPLPLAEYQDAGYRPVIDIDEEIAASQPILDVDEEIVAGLRAEQSDATTTAQPDDGHSHETNDQTVHVLHQNRTIPPGFKASTIESKSMIDDEAMKPQIGMDEGRNLDTNTNSNGLAVRTHASTPQSFTRNRESVKVASSSRNGTGPDGPESSVKKGKKPAREFGTVDLTSELVGWDGKMNQPPVGEDWDRRLPFDPRSHERISVIKAWREEHAADPEESKRAVVNTASVDFQTGEGLAGGDIDVLRPIDKGDHETLASNDDFSQARRHQNAAGAMKDYEAKMAARPKVIPSGIEGMTKEERRSLRRALIEEERTRRTLPNPHAPAANIYLRPAEFKDMSQVTTIYNHYVRTTSFALDLNPVDELYWYVIFSPLLLCI